MRGKHILIRKKGRPSTNVLGTGVNFYFRKFSISPWTMDQKQGTNLRILIHVSKAKFI